MSSTSKIRLLLVMHRLNIGGAQRVMLNLANNISRERFDIHLCLFSAQGELLYLLKDDVVIYDLRSKKVSHGLFSYFRLILTLKPQVLFSSITHVNLINAIFSRLIRILSKGVSIVSREVNIPSERSNSKGGQIIFECLWRKSINTLDSIIVQSDFMKRDLISFYGAEESKLLRIPNLLDRDRIIEKSSILTVNTRIPGKVNLLACGRINVQKGFERLVKIMSMLDDSFHLHLVGDGPERKNIESLIRDNSLDNRVTLYGFQSNPYPFFAEADFVVVSSVYEGFPNVILEANALGKYVVAFRCPGINDEIIIDGVNGSLINDNDILAFSRELKIRCSEPVISERIVTSTRRYSVKQVVSEYEKLFSELISGA